MGKQPTTGQKKSKDSIAKAATQKKAGVKVVGALCRNGPRERPRRKQSMMSSSIRQVTNASSLLYRDLASIFPPLQSLRSSKL